MDDKRDPTLPATYYSLHSDELKLLQFLLYHLRYKYENRSKRVKGLQIEHTKTKADFK
jgi:hypothetical protein